VFLWLYWPSFNAALAPADDQHRAIINTYLALVAATVVTFAMSQLLSHDGKMDMVHVQNATLAGGVAIGTSANMMVQPWGALLIGAIAGAISTIGYVHLTPRLASIRFHDTCGVHNLHGIPGVLAGIFGIIFTALATFENYGNSMYQIWSARAPEPVNGISFSFTVKDGGLMEAKNGLGRTAGTQALWQAASLGLTLAVAIVGGTITGIIINLLAFSKQSEEFYYDDRQFFEVPDEGFDEDKKRMVYQQEHVEDHTQM